LEGGEGFGLGLLSDTFSFVISGLGQKLFIFGKKGVVEKKKGVVQNDIRVVFS
jgi:hypothetical protein